MSIVLAFYLGIATHNKAGLKALDRAVTVVFNSVSPAAFSDLTLGLIGFALINYFPRTVRHETFDLSLHGIPPTRAIPRVGGGLKVLRHIYVTYYGITMYGNNI